jgi:hypothetical protein
MYSAPSVQSVVWWYKEFGDKLSDIENRLCYKVGQLLAAGLLLYPLQRREEGPFHFIKGT